MSKDLAQARAILAEGGYTCVFCRGAEVYTSRERGVAPLLDMLDAGRDMHGFAAADKVVGKAAAFLYALLGGKEVYAGILSEGAQQVLQAHKIPAEYGELTAAIRNRANTGFCPMEEAVAAIEEPAAAEAAIRLKRQQLAAARK